jgi:GT2 family glycosyltransferase
MPDTKITIGVLSQGILKTEMASSLIMAVNSIFCPLHLLFYQGAYIHDNRNQVIEAAKKEGSSHVMFIDYDQTFPVNGIAILLSRNKDIIGGCYNKRTLPLQTTVMASVDGGPIRLLNPDEVPKEPFRCTTVPTGFMLIKMEAIKKIEPPYFSFDPFEGKLVGEDVYFCRKANMAGVEVWCDPTIKIGHIGDYVY